MIGRSVLGALAAAAIALIATRARSLSTSGAVAATLIGALAVTAGWDWGVLVAAYFAASTALSRLGRAEKERRTTAVVAKGGERDAVQVLSNGGVFAIAALLAILSAAAFNTSDPRWLALGAGSLAASAADTWATELGMLYGGTPRALLSWRPVPAGTSGAVSAIGSMSALAGAAFVAAVAWLLGWRALFGAALAGGIAGALVDSLLGATVQQRRWCDACGRETERTIHDCGARTRVARGAAWIDNDMVNFLSNVAGGLVAAGVAAWLAR